MIADIPAKHRLSLSNPSFRANTMIPEGSSSDTAIIPQATGVLIQPLPFSITLKKFHIDFYSTGMPKLFASDVVIQDHDSGKTFAATIKVNQPLIHKGLAIFQSSFDDGGSKLKLRGFPMKGGTGKTFDIDGEVGATTPLVRPGLEPYTVEWSSFRAFNVENVGPGQDVRAVAKDQSLQDQFSVGLDKRLGSAAKNANNKDLKNVGPSVQYKLRDKTGQAREYQSYMLPIQFEGDAVFLAGVRSNPGEAFSFLRIPADDANSVDEWMRLRAALHDGELRKLAAQRYAQHAMGAQADGQLRAQLQESANKSLGIFAGDSEQAGFVAIAKFLEKLPAAEQEKAADIFMKILNGSLWELWQAAREKDGMAPVAANQVHARFMQLATSALADSFFYDAPVYLQLADFTEVKASVLQVTRSPGQNVVYLGCLFLVMGVFAMFYIRERRLWVWIKDHGAGSEALMAMSTQRKTLDFETEFASLKAKLPQSA
jgi:cytochrome c biogenesis protein